MTAMTETRVGVTTQVTVPDIGDFKDVPIIEILVKEGDAINAEDPLLTLESDKATMEVPAPSSGTVEKILVKVGDKVSEGTPILMFKGGDGAMTQPPSLVNQQEPPPQSKPVAVPNTNPAPSQATASADRGAGATTGTADFGNVHASPSVRRVARELGVDLTRLKGSGEKGRITKDDVLNFLKGPAAAPAAAPGSSGGAGIPEIPAVDFSKFGPIETRPLPRIKKLSGPHLHRAWLNVPHVTHNDESDITEIDAYRKELDSSAKEKGYRVTLLAFLMKAAVSALREFPEFNSSLSPEKDSLIVKKYYHIGIAADTPEGLVVPVIRDVDRKGIHELSQELGSASKRARDGKLSAADMQGACFTISSLGGIGGTGFTPIVNAPEVAILGVVRSKMAPVWNGKEFVPRLMLPVSLSYDHRVIDGALAARFSRHLCHVLEDVRRLVL
ncbi:dihydrolipoyllysine-residue acetyltransferase (plasmid) [Skermanella mucosa]|uniref:dihydrolipoyllysine-residue acetyltransferase n=1 Tax=Skermanella mucosa TaxID=1789672 RepID=UPI00192A8610|nr:dihydrolipoyllysine-residue acetyltransferase [Skermanella mucosa]UEM24297.1 dihydrolipoyllysine-residue acetyltransferase [Skermanella mucosa]